MGAGAGAGARRAALAFAVALAVLPLGSLAASGHPGHGKHVIEVRPGHNALTKALRKADPGDKLRVHSGRYRESVEVDKPVEIVGVRKGRRPVIDGQCEALITIAVTSPGVVLERLKVIGATDLNDAGREVDYSRLASGTLEDVRVRDTCDAEYGLNINATGPVSLIGNRATGFSDGGIYLGDIVDTLGGTLLVQGNEAYGNNKGIIVENSTGGDILIHGNDFHDNALPGLREQVGIYISRSDAVRVVGNTVTGSGNIGVWLTPESDGNRLEGNTITGNPTDIRNEGVDNCGSGNVFSTGGPLDPC
jgi:parallel beta-helix repeat protein